MTSRVLIGAGMIAVSVAWIGGIQATNLRAIRTSPESRASYLAHAVMWRDPGTLSATDLLEGPSGSFPYSFQQATSDAGVECRFAQAGRALGGNSPKFLCRTPDGHDLRLKFWDPHSRRGNREVFATVAASRLMWALGFNAVPALPIHIQCQACPENPHEGEGTPATRRYVAMVQTRWQTPVILSSENIDQGWSWRELDNAIRSLPPGVERVRQRTAFDALTLLGVLIQHGDRKPEQQRLYCAAPVETSAGRIGVDKSLVTSLTLFERPNESACPVSAVAIVDVGATFGGAGRSSNPDTAKMNLEAWERRPVFTESTGECRGALKVSLKAGHDGEPDPIISEDGRRFLSAQLQRLTADHVRAIFTAAQVDQLAPNGSIDGSRAIDAWVAAFEDKRRQIVARRCQPAM